MEPDQQDSPWIAFGGDRRIGDGDRRHVARLTKAFADRHPNVSILVFDAVNSRPVEIDLRGSIEDVLARLPPPPAPDGDAVVTVTPLPRRPGRPKLGVVAREVTLLPRHWEWLATQRGGASVAIRRLIDDARRGSGQADCRRAAQESAYRFVSVMAGDRARYEDAIRALFAGDIPQFEAFTAGWPADVRDHARHLASAIPLAEQAPPQGS